MKHPLERHFKVFAEHKIEGKTYDQLALKYGVSKQRIEQLCKSAVVKLQLDRRPASKITPQDIGLAIQRAVESYITRHHRTGTPEWFQRVLREEREEDQRGWLYRNL
jgi:hypothetical protein